MIERIVEKINSIKYIYTVRHAQSLGLTLMFSFVALFFAPIPSYATGYSRRDIQISAAITKYESLAPWFGIYPSIAPHFGNYPLGEYMNGAVLPLVGGELAKAAFQNGFEAYGLEQLKVLEQILSKNNRNLPGCVNTDGTAQKEAIPDEWGQAAFVSALVEGLAGVVDKSILFREVEISPRWYFAGVPKTSVKVGYGGDGNQVEYRYAYDSKNKEMKVTTRGKFDQYTLRVPFPEKAAGANASVNGKEVALTVDDVNESRYAVIKGSGSSNDVKIQFK